MLLFLLFLVQLATTAGERQRRYASLPAAAQSYDIPVRTLRDWISRGLLPGYRIGPRLLRIDLDDLEKMMRRIPAAGDSEDGPAA